MREYLVMSQTGGEVVTEVMHQQSLMQRIISCTHELVDQAMQADWSGVLDGMEARRQLLRSVVEQDVGRFNPEVFALTAAVEESERALTRVVAHAIAGTRITGAEFAMYH